MYARFYMLTCTKPRSMNGINASWDIVRESDIEIDFTDLMRTRKAVNFIEKYNRVSAKARRNYETSIEPRLAYSPPRRLQLVSRLFKNRTNFTFSRNCRAHFLKSRVCKPCENPRQRSLSAPTRISEYDGIPGKQMLSPRWSPEDNVLSGELTISRKEESIVACQVRLAHKTV